MYQGKFDSKNKKSSTNVHEIVAQRNSATAKPQRSMQKQRVVQAAPAKKKQRSRLGGRIFYTLFLLFVLVFYGATFLGLHWLQNWLVDYENAQPTLKCQEVFDRYFAEHKWEELYDAAGSSGVSYEGKESFVTYMENKVGGSELTYVETSTGLSKDKKYIVRMGDEKIASFTLVDENNAQTNTELPDWQLGAIEFFFEGEESYRIQMLEGHTAFINNVPLDDSHTIQTATTKAGEYLPVGAAAPRIRIQEVSGLMAKPTVSITDENGAESSVTYDEANHTFIEQTANNTISEEEKEVALEAVKTYAKFMTNHAGAGNVAKYFSKSSEIYTTIIETDRSSVQDDSGYTFTDETVTDYCRYNDSLFSVRVAMTMNLNRPNGTVKENKIDQSLFFTKQESGNWICYNMTAVDVSAFISEVRLTFMDGNTVLDSGFHSADSSQLTCPAVTAPEGKVFSGWMVEEMDESGNAVMRLVFQPDENGVVTIPAGTSLEPMTLYPLFENA